MPPEQVYRDEAIPTKLREGSAISSSSQPAIMAIMLEQLRLEPGHRVLEIGAGTGYNAALMAHVVGETGQVVTVDLEEDLVAGARKHLAAAGLNRVRVVCGDGALGFPDDGPYDRIILTVGAADLMPAWQEQLKPDGRLVLPLSIRGPQLSVAFERADGHLASVSLVSCGFMMLRGARAEPGSTLRLGDEPGLHLTASESALADAEAAYRWLASPSREQPVGIRVTAAEAFSALRLWLALREPRFCDLYAEGAWVDRGLVPPLFGWRSGGGSVCGTYGLLGDAGLCVLAHSPDPARSPDGRPISPFDLFARSFGPDGSLAHSLLDQVRAWEATGRPATDTLRIRAYPSDTDYIPAAREVIVPKRGCRLVLDWQ
jgi:protein-L-isoaspartate(D-aspartate) O-methyltransferase